MFDLSITQAFSFPDYIPKTVNTVEWQEEMWAAGKRLFLLIDVFSRQWRHRQLEFFRVTSSTVRCDKT